MLDTSQYVDSFARDRLPPFELWPDLTSSEPARYSYPKRVNAAVELLDKGAAAFGDRPCVRSPSRTWSYEGLLDSANRIASVLVDDFGLQPGNRVLLRSANSPMLAACWLAVLKAGGIAVATMPLLRSRELAYVLRKADVQFALCDARLGDELAAAAPARPGLQTVHFGTKAGDGLEARMAVHSSNFANVIPSHDDVALIAFTSGTTGPAKATAHFHRDVLAICDALPPAALLPTPDDVFAGSAPFAFTFGLGALLLFPLRFGASSVLLEYPAPDALLNAVQTERVSILFTVPTLYRAMTPLAGDFDLTSLRTCVSSGEHLPKSVFDGWLAATGLPLVNSLGSTEMLHAFVAVSHDQTTYGSLGRALPGYRTAVMTDDMTELPPGEVGRLAVRGPTGCRYLDDEPRQRTYVRNGWNLTGDAVSADGSGRLTYHARTDDMIVSAGYNISGPEIEEALLTHPAVRECAVVGLPDPARGQVVAAFVVANGAGASDGLTEALQDHVKASIAPYKYPRIVVFVPELPKTASGKIQRHVLRERAASADASVHQPAAVHVDRATGHE